MPTTSRPDRFPPHLFCTGCRAPEALQDFTNVMQVICKEPTFGPWESCTVELCRLAERRRALLEGTTGGACSNPITATCPFDAGVDSAGVRQASCNVTGKVTIVPGGYYDIYSQATAGDGTTTAQAKQPGRFQSKPYP